MRGLYPEIEPFDTGTLAVDARHRIHYEQCGNPDGKPVVMLHGGPGAGCGAKMRRFHDPSRYRIVLFDQRGAGRSTPGHRALAGVRRQLGIDAGARVRRSAPGRRHGTGAARHLHAAALGTGMVLPAGLLATVPGRVGEIPRADSRGRAARPDERLPPPADVAGRSGATRRRPRTSFLRQDEAFIRSHEDPHFALSFARIECHYFVHGGFFDADDQLLRDAHRLKGIPGVIAHGRYDVVCPAQNAWDLHKAWPGSRLEFAPLSGHSAFETQLTDILVRATDSFR